MVTSCCLQVEIAQCFKIVLQGFMRCESLDVIQATIAALSISFVRTFLSKRKLAQVVDSGAATGWDDSRMPSVRGLLRRGLTVQALRMLRQGPSRNLERRDYGLDDTVGHEPEGDRPGRATSYSGRDGANCRGVCHDGLISRTLCLSPDIRRGLRSRRGWLRTVGPYFWITRMRRP